MTDPKTLRRWILFRLTPMPNGSVQKFPVSLHGGPAAVDDPDTWGTYEEACKACAENSNLALGFVLGKDVGLCCVDIDKARESREQPWPGWVERLVEEINSFTEDSVSGFGKHVWCWATIPSNLNRQACHVEIHDSNRMFVVSQAFADEWEKIQTRDLTELHRRISEGKIGPNYRPPIIAFPYNETKFRAIITGNFEPYFSSRSEAVASALCTLAVKHNGDAEAVRSEFERSTLCEIWADKWDRLGDKEIERAIEWYERHKHAHAIEELPEFKHPRVDGERTYVMQPREEFDGWMPTRSVSVVGGPSGAGKTSFLLDLMSRQAKGEEMYGHKTNALPFLVLFADRMESDNLETLKRMRLEHLAQFTESLPLCWDSEAVVAILDRIESRQPLPRIVIVEGADMLAGDASDMKHVSVMISRLQQIATQYNLSMILSVGAPKAKPGEQYVLMRDRIYGSQVFGRMASSIVTMSYAKDSEGTDSRRVLDASHRNAASEHYDLEFVNGLLALGAPLVEADHVSVWAAERGDWFTTVEALEALESGGAPISKPAAKKRIMELRKQGKLEERRAEGKFQFRWRLEQNSVA